MQGELENALQDMSPGTKEQLALGNLLEETQRLKSITAGLLLLARADSGELKPDFRILNFACMLEPIIEDARAMSEELEIQWETHISPDVFVRADPGLLRTAILNLFVNAVKYNQAQGRIEVSLTTEDDHAILSLGNSGPGVPEQDRDRIFNRFHRADTSRNRKVDGVGLGLNLSREILRVHGGDVGLKESRPGWTCFEMKLRLSAAPAIAEPAQGPPR
jgi:signal transduction histidine kinase